MRSADLTASSIRYRLLLALLALVGAAFVLLSTSGYGAGLSPDSVSYVGTARNMAAGMGVIGYDGAPLVEQPPLYPALLALVGKTHGADPLLFAHIVNALLFGLVVYLGGLLASRYLPSSPVLAVIAELALVFSIPLFYVAGWVWSEPLFISCVLLGLIFAHSYLAEGNVISLMLLSSSVALASLTRYIGVTLILWGALTILILRRDSIARKAAHAALFALVSALPLGLWLVRNLAVSGTLVGSRLPSASALSQNLTLVFDGVLYWYVGGDIARHPWILMILCAGIGLLAGLSLRDSWQGVRAKLRRISPAILVAVIYAAFLAASSTTTAYDAIDDRLLSPIYVPLTLSFLVLAQALAGPYRKRLSTRAARFALVIGTALWLTYPIHTTMVNAGNLRSHGQGYSRQAWADSETMQFLREHRTPDSERLIYSNGPDAVYILADIAARMSPVAGRWGTPEGVNGVSGLRDSWPEGSSASLVWFDRIDREYLHTVDELQTVANVQQVIRLEDGALYSVASE